MDWPRLMVEVKFHSKYLTGLNLSVLITIEHNKTIRFDEKKTFLINFGRVALKRLAMGLALTAASLNKKLASLTGWKSASLTGGGGGGGGLNILINSDEMHILRD